MFGKGKLCLLILIAILALEIFCLPMNVCADYFSGQSGYKSVSSVGTTGSYLIIGGDGTSYRSISTTFSPPSITTLAATSIGKTTATLSGNITAVNDTSIAAIGFDWDTDSGEPYANSWSTTGTFGTGSFSHPITSLSPGTALLLQGYCYEHLR